MRHLLTVIIVSVIAFVVYASVDWNSIDLSLSIPPNDIDADGNEPKKYISFCNEDFEEDVKL